MGQMQLFTPEQKLIFNKVKDDPFFRSRFYFTGGTALSYFYLKHRFSEDLDFFSEEKFDTAPVLERIEAWAKIEDFTFQSQWREVVYVFQIEFKNGKKLKIDFGHYPHTRVEKGLNENGFAIDSQLDIAVNKLATINQRNQVRDYVDLYYLLDTFTIWDLIEGARIKFRMKLEPWILASDLSYGVEQFSALPRMIKPLTLTILKTFFRKKALELAKTSVK